jgi:hypothetical protein
MTEETPQNFDGFILPDGEIVSIQDVDRMVSYFCRRMEVRDRIVEALWDLSYDCIDRGHYGAAYAYADKILAMVESPIEQAFCFLKMGQIREKAGDLLAALETYSRAFSLPQKAMYARPGFVHPTHAHFNCWKTFLRPTRRYSIQSRIFWSGWIFTKRMCKQ